VTRRRRKRRPRTPPPKSPERKPEVTARNRPRAARERPPAPWGSFPLVELTILVGLAMLIAGFIIQGSRGVVMIGTGAALCSLGGLELSIREHFAGYRSHTFLLAAAVAVAVLAGLYYFAPDLSLALRLAAAGGAFGLVAWALMRAFRRRSGLAFKVR
jgi:uncharacterized BrkB/YihY/UPF0761 family membrane protein